MCKRGRKKMREEERKKYGKLHVKGEGKRFY
jgi:hypothetical protein